MFPVVTSNRAHMAVGTLPAASLSEGVSMGSSHYSTFSPKVCLQSHQPHIFALDASLRRSFTFLPLNIVCVVADGKPLMGQDDCVRCELCLARPGGHHFSQVQQRSIGASAGWHLDAYQRMQPLRLPHCAQAGGEPRTARGRARGTITGNEIFLG